MKFFGTKHLGLGIVVIASLFFIFPAAVNAQAKPARKANNRVVLEPRFGPFQDSMTPLADDFRKLAAAGSLIVTDTVSKQQWKVISYQLNWKRKEVSDNFKTGKSEFISNLVGTTVHNSSKIPEVWAKEMGEYLQPAEQIYFDRIIVQHPTTKQNRLAPSFQLLIR